MISSLKLLITKIFYLFFPCFRLGLNYFCAITKYSKLVLSHLSNKSSANLQASTMLINNELYASSVHCSYYAVLQHMTCILNEKLKLSFELILKKSNGPGSHNYVIDTTISYLISKIDSTESIIKEVEKTNIYKLKSKIRDLKLLRVESDYHNLEIDSLKSQKSLNMSQEIIKKLNS